MSRLKAFAVSSAMGLGLLLAATIPSTASAHTGADGVNQVPTYSTVAHRYGGSYRGRSYDPSPGYYYGTPRYQGYYSPYRSQPNYYGPRYGARYGSFYRYPSYGNRGFYRSDAYRGAIIGGNIGGAIGGWRGGQIGAAIGAAIAD